MPGRHRRVRIASVALLAAASALTAGCGSELEGRIASGIVTVVTPATIAAGGVADVACELVGAYGYDHVATTFSVEPAESVTTTDHTVSATRAGTYRVHCSAPDFGLHDDEGATLEVVAADPVKVTVAFGANPVTAGERTSVGCVTVDAYGNAVPVEGQIVAASPLAVSGGQIWSEEAGAFEVRCAAPDRPGLPSEPAVLTVRPAAPAHVALRVSPERDVFAPRAVATLYWVVTDAFGNEVPGVDATLTPPAGDGYVVVDAAAHKYRLVDEGRYTFRVTLAPPDDALTDALTLTVDGTPPELVITWPPRGETVVGDGTPILIEGTLRDTWSGVAQFEINGEPVEVDADGAFAHPMAPSWGLNLIEAYAEDRGGHVVRLTPTFHYSAEYLPFVDSSAEGLKHDDGLLVLLGQDFLDDGVHDHAHLDDLATIFEVLIGDLDLAGIVSEAVGGVADQIIPLADQHWTIGIDNVSWLDVTLVGDLEIALAAAETTDLGPTHVAIDSRAGGLDVDVVMGGEGADAFALDLSLSATATFELYAEACSFLGCVPALAEPIVLLGDATLTSGVSLDLFELMLYADIAKAPGGDLTVSYQTFDSNLEGLDVDPIQDVVLSLGVINLPLVGDQVLTFPLSDLIDLNALIGGLIDPINDVLINVVPALVNPLLEQLAGPLIEGLFDLLVVDTSFELPPLLGARDEPAFLDFYTALSSVAFTDEGGAVGLSAGFYADKGVERDPAGAILRAGCLKGTGDQLTWGWSPSVAFGLRTDMVNSALFGAWWTGFLNGPLDAGALGGGGALPIPIEDRSLELTWLLPPIVNDCRKGDPLLQVGDLYVVMRGHVFGGDVTIGLYADLSLAAAFETSDEGLSLRIGQLLFADFEVVEQDAGALADVVDVEVLVEEALPGLIDSFLVGQSLGPFSLPPTDLSTVVPGLPAGTTLGLGPLSVVHQSGYVVVGGDLE